MPCLGAEKQTNGHVSGLYWQGNHGGSQTAKTKANGWGEIAGQARNDGWVGPAMTVSLNPQWQ